MFGGKKDEKKLETPKNLQVTAIPSDFYAGADPTVKFKKTETTVDLSRLTGEPGQAIKDSEKKKFDSQNSKGGLLSSSRFWVIGAASLFIFFLAGGGLYYWWTLRSSQSSTTIIPPPIIAEIPTITPPNIIDEPNNIISEDTTTTQESEIDGRILLDLPGRLLSFAVDVDNDGVSDAAELFFGSDPGNPDTDGDGYPDGHELYYLYNPGGVRPEKLIDSGRVNLFRSANFNYEIYYPQTWMTGSVDNEGRQVLFSTLTGEYIEVRVLDREIGESQLQWFEKHTAPSENFSDYLDFSSRFNASGKVRKDGLVYLIFDFDRVYALIYHVPTTLDVVNYQSVLMVMARSFYIGSSVNETPTMIIEEGRVNGNPWPFETPTNNIIDNLNNQININDTELNLNDNVVINNQEEIDLNLANDDDLNMDSGLADDIIF